MKCVVAQFQQESNSFSPVACTMEKFRSSCLVSGKALLSNFESTSTELGGFICTLKSAGVQIIPAVAAGAVSCGPVNNDVCDYVLSEIMTSIQAAGKVDCVLLSLHGAMLLQGHSDGTGYFLAELRKRLGNGMLIACSLDFHANLTHKIIENADILLGYKTYPHIDLFEIGCRVAQTAIQSLRGGCRPVMRMCKLPMILHSEVSQTSAYPMKELMNLVQDIEQRDRVISASVFQVQPWLNVDDTGCACLVVTDGCDDTAQEYVRELGQHFWDLRHQFRFAPTPLSLAVRSVMEDEGNSPIIFADAADGTGSGSPGDSPAILRELLAQGFQQKVLLTIVDPPAVQAAIDTGLGNIGRFTVGGKIDTIRHSPVSVTGKVNKLSDGRFVLKGPQSTGSICDMGQTAVVQVKNIHIVVMENSVNNWDPSLYRSLGLEPMAARIVVVKSPAAFRAAYAEITHEVCFVDAPGASSANFGNLGFDKIPRPMYPFDDWNFSIQTGQ